MSPADSTITSYGACKAVGEAKPLVRVFIFLSLAESLCFKSVNICEQTVYHDDFISSVSLARCHKHKSAQSSEFLITRFFVAHLTGS